MYGLNTDRRNYHSLVIAGLGAVGSSLVKLGWRELGLFDHVVAVDVINDRLLFCQDSDINCICGDVTDSSLVHSLMSTTPGPTLFVNLCSSTDNVRIRTALSFHDAAYIDSCASMTQDPEECRFSRLMPYTYSTIDSRYPHWLCWGVNPGVVELIARRLLKELPAEKNCYDVTIYEYDRLENVSDTEKAAVGWCPAALIEEVMLSPTLQIIDGNPVEDNTLGTRDNTASWEDTPVAARVVGHEDIWNMGSIPCVKNSRFLYSLGPAVMQLLKTDTKLAGDLLYIPTSQKESIAGLEQVAVQVSGKDLSKPQTLVWTEDHGEMWQRFRVNAVQYQTAKSILLAIKLLQQTGYGTLPIACNGSNLPIGEADWQIIDSFMEELGINWQDGTYLNLKAEE